MKNKILSVLLILCMSVGVCACSKTEGSNKKASNDESIIVEDEATVENSTEEVEKEAEKNVPEWLYFPYKEEHFYYSIMLPSDACRDAGYGYQCWIDGTNTGEIVYITQYAGEVGDDFQKENIDMTTYNSSEDIFDLLAINFEHETVIGHNFKLCDYTVEVVENVTINGYEMTKFQGELNVLFDFLGENYYTFPIIAYGIKTEKTPVLVCCIDRSSSEPNGVSTHEEWVTRIDDIVATFEE